MSIVLECFGATDRGKVRRQNEDQFLIAELVKSMVVTQSSLPAHDGADWARGVRGHLLVVADGMGGLAGGEIASGLAVETITWFVAKTMPWFHRYQDGREEELETELLVAVEACQRTVSDAAAASSFHRMGTTLTMAYVLWPRLYVVHAGDSRCYLHRNGELHQMTHDHTLAQRAVDAGLMTPEEAGKSRMGHALWKCISGVSGDVKPDLYRATLEPGDGILLCSDGLTRGLTDDQILQVLEKGGPPQAAATELITAANDAGGPDNITVVFARVCGDATSVHDTLPDGSTVASTM